MVLSQTDLDRLFPPPLAPHCEGSHDYGEPAAEHRETDLETGTPMSCDTMGPHTPRLCRRHADIGKTGACDWCKRERETTILTTWSVLLCNECTDKAVEWFAKNRNVPPGEERPIVPGDRPEGSPPLHPNVGVQGAPSAPQSPDFRRLYVGLCEVHHDRTKNGELEVVAQYPVSQASCTACQFTRFHQLAEKEMELEQAQGWVNTITEQRDAARAERDGLRQKMKEDREALDSTERIKESADARISICESYAFATRRMLKAEAALERMKVKAKAAKGKAKKKRGARR